ncbi:GATA transcription factor 5-like isoform X2 [Rhodamnia argentea]|uniref:GATA transcription factor n=1 Tax=Rhodamnia argentea TaxID=178133 RepID=A0ABM3HRU5_9MYRT|nr:GATA transcription factor 5-like isoform X2 [Rhodamnia argentea]
MECVEAALKAGLGKDAMLVKLMRPRAFSDDLLSFNSHGGAAPNDGGCDGDDFVDDFFDFSNDDAFAEQEEEATKEEAGHEQQLPQKREPHDGTGENAASVSAGQEDDLGLAPHLPAEDLADLEWLSHFVEDSFSHFSEPLPAGVLLQNPIKREDRSEPESESSGSSRPGFTTPLPSKARSKRSRTGGRVWSLGVPSLPEPSSSSSSSTTASSPLLSSPWFVHLNRSGSLEPVEPEPWDAEPPMKKQKKPAASETTGPARRCSHCGVQKTPQWRAGPNGAKTLCNACGVRFKSGRLFPEYRPACSPTFCSELHSNHHRKVLEMRRKKEPTPGQPEPGRAVPSF